MLFCDALRKVNKIMLNVTLTPASITHLLISAYIVLDPSRRISMGLTDSRKTAKNLVDSRKK